MKTNLLSNYLYLVLTPVKIHTASEMGKWRHFWPSAIPNFRTIWSSKIPLRVKKFPGSVQHVNDF